MVWQGARGKSKIRQKEFSRAWVEQAASRYKAGLYNLALFQLSYLKSFCYSSPPTVRQHRLSIIKRPLEPDRLSTSQRFSLALLRLVMTVNDLGHGQTVQLAL